MSEIAKFRNYENLAMSEKTRMEELVRLRNNCPRCRIIISSRPIGLKKEDYPGFYPAELLPLDAEMIDSYLQRWFKNDSQAIARLGDTFQHKPRIAALATNPFLLSMICFTFQHGDCLFRVTLLQSQQRPYVMRLNAGLRQ